MIRLALIAIIFMFLHCRPPGDIKIISRWDLPVELLEVSGIAYINANHFACVQDEAGTIYIYNTAMRKLEREIAFTGAGDFEGIALVGNTAWMLRSDGKLYEVNDYNEKNLKVIEYPSGLMLKQNVEGLCYDQKNNRLLMAIKDAPRGDQTYKGIYAFDLNKKILNTEPVIRINLQDKIFKSGNQKKGHDFMPTDLAIHPLTGEIYIIDGTRVSLMIMDPTGAIKQLIKLDSRVFTQPEGISFDPQGHLFISNEGIKNPGNILQIAID